MRLPISGGKKEHLLVGDTATFFADAFSAPPGGYGCPLYDSFKHPERFTFTSTDTTVAVIGDDGFLKARKVGETVLQAVTRGVYSNALVLQVSAREEEARPIGVPGTPPGGSRGPDHRRGGGHLDRGASPAAPRGPHAPGREPRPGFDRTRGGDPARTT